MEEKRFEELLSVMARLRGPEGCPWDREQTPESLKKYIIEEAYEVVEAIGGKDKDALAEELGDLLFQVVFQSQLAREAGLFDMGDILDKVTDKMKRRHPHVFGDVEVSGAEEVLHNWEMIKKNEKEERRSIFDGIPTSQPSLRWAARVQQRASTVGFDWKEAAPVLGKFKEEVEELDRAIASRNKKMMSRELGDVLFSAVNLARHLGIEAEDSLREAIEKFQNRFRKIEKKLAEEGCSPKDVTLDELDALWDLAKDGENEDL